MAKDKQRKVILDTNLWISFLISNTFSKLGQYILRGDIRLLFSEESLSEFLEVATRPTFEDYFTHADIVELFEYMDRYGEIIKVSSKVDFCRDKKDNFWLELAKDGKADYLVTGDNDLLVIGTFEKTKILILTDLLNEMI